MSRRSGRSHRAAGALTAPGHDPAALQISGTERDALHCLLCRRLFVLGQDPPELARKEGVSLERLAEEFGEDLRLMDAIGWQPESDRDQLALSVPADSLTRTLKRLRRDARRAPYERRQPLEPSESAEERWQRFRRFVDVCEALLGRLAPPAQEDGESARDPHCPLKTTPSRSRRIAMKMNGWSSRSGVTLRIPFPEPIPPELNHIVLTGTLSAEPRSARSPHGDVVTLLRLVFPVRDPKRPQDLWTWASCEVEVPEPLARRSVPGLQVGAPVLVGGQLSEREGGGEDCRSVILAAIVHSGEPPSDHRPVLSVFGDG